MKSIPVSLLVATALAGSALSLHASSVFVAGTSDPWLAGQPNGTTASFEDVAPAESPTLAGLVTAGSTITWSATGLETNGAGFPFLGPNGDTGGISFGVIDHTAIGAQNGIADVFAPVDALIGVFVGPGVPVDPAPSGLDFSTPAAQGYSSLSPDLYQPFYMGDGTGKSVIVPVGATRLFLGVMDGFGWDNNLGGFQVDLQNVQGVPDGGSTAALLLVGLAAFARRKTSR